MTTTNKSKATEDVTSGLEAKVEQLQAALEAASAQSFEKDVRISVITQMLQEAQRNNLEMSVKASTLNIENQRLQQLVGPGHPGFERTIEQMN